MAHITTNIHLDDRQRLIVNDIQLHEANVGRSYYTRKIEVFRGDELIHVITIFANNPTQLQ